MVCWFVGLLVCCLFGWASLGSGFLGEVGLIWVTGNGFLRGGGCREMAPLVPGFFRWFLRVVSCEIIFGFLLVRNT